MVRLCSLSGCRKYLNFCKCDYEGFMGFVDFRAEPMNL